jgi:hypothetical protein
MFLICDAPSHGEAYHKNTSLGFDNHSSKVKDFELE